LTKGESIAIFIERFGDGSLKTEQQQRKIKKEYVRKNKTLRILLSKEKRINIKLAKAKLRIN